MIELEQEHYKYFSNVDQHIQSLGDAYLGRLAGTSADTGKHKGIVVKDK